MASVKRTNEKVILFPATVDYYQVQIIHYLEAEKYADALALLQYLQQFSVDEQTTKEWHVLMTWLRGGLDEEENQMLDQDWTEDSIRSQVISEKLRQERDYTAKLLDTLTHTTKMEKQLLSLEQLSVLDHPEINQQIIDWLATKVVHPLVQFKALQVLRSRGVKRTVSILRNRKMLKFSVESTPLLFSQFPLPIRRVLNRVIEAAEKSYVSVGFFAEEMWTDFVSQVFGSDTYRKLTALDEAQISVWAAVLHRLVLESLHMPVDFKELEQIYGVDMENPKNELKTTNISWQKTYTTMKNFAKI